MVREKSREKEIRKAREAGVRWNFKGKDHGEGDL